MLKRIHIKGYKSLRDVEMELKPLTVLFGPNSGGKSNFLEALQLLSRLVASNSIKEAFDPPYRGKPLESFSFPPEGLKGLRDQKSVSFSIEVDFTLSDFIVEGVNELIGEIENRHEVDVSGAGEMTKNEASVQEKKKKELVKAKNKKRPIKAKKNKELVQAKNLRYRIEIEMQPNKGFFRVLDEYLAGIDEKGKPLEDDNSIENSFLSTPDELKDKDKDKDKEHRFIWMKEGIDKLILLSVGVDRSTLSQHVYPPLFPYLTAAREEIASWSSFYFEPRERMRTPNPVKSVRRMGLMGEDLPAYLNTLKAEQPRQFEALEKSLKLMLPRIEGIDVHVNDHGEVELSLKEDGVFISARVLSEGTLRMLGLLALAGAREPPSLVGLEEPENGINPRRIELVARFLETQTSVNQTQYIITTHSPFLADWLPKESLFVVTRGSEDTRIEPFSVFGPLGHRLKKGRAIDMALTDTVEAVDCGPSSVSERILRGDFDG